VKTHWWSFCIVVNSCYIPVWNFCFLLIWFCSADNALNGGFIVGYVADQFEFSSCSTSYSYVVVRLIRICSTTVRYSLLDILMGWDPWCSKLHEQIVTWYVFSGLWNFLCFCLIFEALLVSIHLQLPLVLFLLLCEEWRYMFMLVYSTYFLSFCDC